MALLLLPFTRNKGEEMIDNPILLGPAVFFGLITIAKRPEFEKGSKDYLFTVIGALIAALFAVLAVARRQRSCLLAFTNPPRLNPTPALTRRPFTFAAARRGFVRVCRVKFALH